MFEDNSRRETGRQPPGGLVVLLVALVALTTPAATALDVTPAKDPTATETEPAFVVALDADGSARTTLTVTFDLTSESERRAFEALRENTTAREQRAEKFATRMRAIAARAENRTGREMAIHDPAISFTEHNDTGVVALSVTWDGLAATRGEQLVVTAPFASGFTLDRTFRVVGPEGYELTAVTPSPTERSSNAAGWPGGTDFEGFEAVFGPQPATTAASEDRTGENSTTTTPEPTAASDGGTEAVDTTQDALKENDTAGGDGPGFGVAVGLLAVLGSIALMASRTRR